VTRRLQDNPLNAPRRASSSDNASRAQSGLMTDLLHPRGAKIPLVYLTRYPLPAPACAFSLPPACPAGASAGRSRPAPAQNTRGRSMPRVPPLLIPHALPATFAICLTTGALGAHLRCTVRRAMLGRHRSLSGPDSGQFLSASTPALGNSRRPAACPASVAPPSPAPTPSAKEWFGLSVESRPLPALEARHA